MCLDGASAQTQRCRRSCVGHALDQQQHDLTFAWGEPLESLANVLVKIEGTGAVHAHRNSRSNASESFEVRARFMLSADICEDLASCSQRTTNAMGICKL